MLNRLNEAIKARDKQEMFSAMANLDKVNWTLHSFKFQEEYEELVDKANEILNES